jgi:hypothetical protein
MHARPARLHATHLPAINKNKRVRDGAAISLTWSRTPALKMIWRKKHVENQPGKQNPPSWCAETKPSDLCLVDAVAAGVLITGRPGFWVFTLKQSGEDEAHIGHSLREG